MSLDKFDDGSDILLINNQRFSRSLYHESLHNWSEGHLRSFPWRLTENPFHILIAEMMLRRTQAKQVAPVYSRFIFQYPDPDKLASASYEEIAQVLYPLGLAWRVPAFQSIAQLLVHEYHGSVPRHYQTLLSLPGVGDYVASAICCFAFNQAVPIIDTNTVRVAGRLFNIPTHAESRRRQPVRNLLLQLLNTQNPRLYNYTLLDLASSVCTPIHPQCNTCPLYHQCATGQLRSH